MDLLVRQNMWSAINQVKASNDDHSVDGLIVVPALLYSQLAFLPIPLHIRPTQHPKLISC